MRRFARLFIVLLFALPLAAQEKPHDYWQILLTGNGTYVLGKLAYNDLIAQRQALIDDQYPPITVLSCSDSRVPPELIFNQSLGSLFVVRSAGSVADDFGIASIEYAIAMGYTQLIVVLGHTNCGAVESSLALDTNCGPGENGKEKCPTTPSLELLKTRIRASFVGIPYLNSPTNRQTAIIANTRASAAQLLAASTVIRGAVNAPPPRVSVRLVTAIYDLATGKVTEIK